MHDYQNKKLRLGDTAFNIKLKKFGIVVEMTKWDDLFRVKEDLPNRLAGNDTFFWSSRLTIKLDPDSPQHRLAVQLKYS